MCTLCDVQICIQIFISSKVHCFFVEETFKTLCYSFGDIHRTLLPCAVCATQPQNLFFLLLVNLHPPPCAPPHSPASGNSSVSVTSWDGLQAFCMGEIMQGLSLSASLLVPFNTRTSSSIHEAQMTGSHPSSGAEWRLILCVPCFLCLSWVDGQLGSFQF